MGGRGSDRGRMSTSVGARRVFGTVSVEEHRGELGPDPAGIAALELVVVLELARVTFAQKNRDLSAIGTQELDRGCHHGVE